MTEYEMSMAHLGSDCSIHLKRMSGSLPKCAMIISYWVGQGRLAQGAKDLVEVYARRCDPHGAPQVV